MKRLNRRNPGTGQIAVNAEVVTRWRNRRVRLETELDQHPDSDWAWLWQTRAKVLEYLIERYQDTQGEPAHTTKPSALPAHRPAKGKADKVEPTTAYEQVPQPPAFSAADDGRLSEHRQRLASLHKTNETRRATQPPIPPTPPPRPRFTPSRPKPERRPAPQPLSEEAVADAAHALYLLIERSKRGVIRTTFPDELPQELRDESLHQLALELELADNEQNGIAMFRRVLGYDLGVFELDDELLDEQSLRNILEEHGIDPDAIN